jgi:hypothetical protein
MSLGTLQNMNSKHMAYLLGSETHGKGAQLHGNWHRLGRCIGSRHSMWLRLEKAAAIDTMLGCGQVFWPPACILLLHEGKKCKVKLRACG